jgi:curved DNA-binding protein CbpA
MGKDGKQSYYEILDVSFNANPEVIRTAYIRAKNSYNRDSLASYSLFDKEDSKRILDEIEEAYTVLSDSEKRRKYDESHGIVSSESVYESYHRGNHAVAAFAREAMAEDQELSSSFVLENDPFRRQAEPPPPSVRVAAAAEPSLPASDTGNVLSPLERLRAMQDLNKGSSHPRSQPIPRAFEANAEMEDRLRKCENVNGPFLRSAREYKKVTVDEIMNILKISKNYLNALEEDDISRLPASVFVRGFVIQYAKALKLEHEKVANAYMSFLRSKRPG